MRQGGDNATPVQHQPEDFLTSFMVSADEICDSHGAKCELFAQVLRSYGKAQLRVTGTSMLPAVWPGDTLTICREDLSQVVPGKIVLFIRDHHRLCAHRVRGKVSQGGQLFLVTRGDRLSENDPAVSKDELLGTVTSILRGTSTITPGAAPTFAGRILAMCSRLSEWPVKILLLLDALFSEPYGDQNRRSHAE